MLPNLRLLGLAALALVALPACDSASTSADGGGGSGGSGGSGTSSFTVQSVSVTNGQVWQINRPIDVTFSKAVDFATVGLNTIAISTPSGLSATGVFSATSDPRRVRFQPACPTQSDNSDAGLVPGGTTYTIHVLDTDDNGVTVRDTAGQPGGLGLVHDADLDGLPGAVPGHRARPAVRARPQPCWGELHGCERDLPRDR